MSNLSNQALIGITCALCFVSGLAGALLALAIDEPDVVYTREFPAAPVAEPGLAPSPADLERLTARYIELTGVNEQWTASLIGEIGGAVCDDGQSAGDLLADYGPDISLERPALDEFVDEVNAACPAS